MFKKLLQNLNVLSTAEETRKVSLYMKKVVDKREEKARKKRIKKVKACIEGEIARSALKGEMACTVPGINEDIAEPLAQWLSGLGYKASYTPGYYGRRYHISWEEQNDN